MGRLSCGAALLAAADQACWRSTASRATLEDLIALSEQVIASYSPSLTRSMVFQLVGGRLDLYHAVFDEIKHEIIWSVSATLAEFRRLKPAVSRCA